MIKSSMMKAMTASFLVATAFSVSAQAQTGIPFFSTGQVIPEQVVVDASTYVVERAKRNPGMESLIDSAKAIFIVPKYGETSSVGDRARALAMTSNVEPATTDLTTQGSPGAFLLRGLGGWSSPAFFTVAWPNYSNESRDSYARGTPIVMVFMTDRAARRIRGCATGTCSLSGLQVTRYSNDSGSAIAAADVVVWTPYGMQSAAPVRGERISFRDLASSDFYDNQATLWQILNNIVSTDRAWWLQTALLTRTTSLE
jgi:lipid-binding SYLF domain-containing protein